MIGAGNESIFFLPVDRYLASEKELPSQTSQSADPLAVVIDHYRRVAARILFRTRGRSPSRQRGQRGQSADSNKSQFTKVSDSNYRFQNTRSRDLLTDSPTCMTLG
jgi:hypothetical protein